MFVIQCKSNGMFLTDGFRYAMTFKKAGRLYDADEALETGRFNLGDDFDIHSFYDFIYNDYFPLVNLPHEDLPY